MVDKYITLCNKISDRYLSFVLTTLCRYNNPKLKSELKDYYKRTNTLFSEIYLEEKREYLKVEKSEIKKLNFCEEMHNFLESENFRPYYHQYNAWMNILDNQNCLITTGTGSGKTECFLYPVFDYLLKVDAKKTKVLIIYPLKALSDNQKIRINKNLDKLNIRYNKKICCNVFDGDTPDNERQQIFSNPPDILLTNYSMLDRILTDPKYNVLLQNFDLKYLIIDEIHSYRGSKGIDLSLLIRRLQYNILKLSNNLDRIQYVGTSATLGDKDEIENTVKFVRKIFNLEDNKFNKSNIVESEELEKNIFKLSEIDNNSLFNKEYKIHNFFKKVDPFFRCVSCGKLYHNSEIKNVCDCGSKSIFEIYTCRSCGKEYYFFDGFIVNGNTNNKIKLDKRFFSLGNKITCNKSSFSNSNQSIQFLFSIADKNTTEDNLLKLYLDSVTNDLLNSCVESQKSIPINVLVKKQNNKDFIEFSGLDVKNNRFCYFCNQKATSNRDGIIAPLYKISNENSSHIVFDELYSNLGEATNNNRKILIFTDNVQRSSKFAREIEETHIKNVVRRELLNLLLEQDDYIEFESLRDKIKSKLNKQGIDENVKNKIILEMYNELIAKSQKVGSLVSRGWIKTKLNYSGDDISNEQLKMIYFWFKNKKLIKECYELSNPANYYQIRNKGIRKIEEILAKKLKISILDMKQIFTELQKKNLIVRSQDNLYLINEAHIIIKKGKTNHIDSDNYFDTWNYDVPIIKTENDTGKTDSEYRKKIESDFRESQELILIATPTLELGIDIGDLTCVGQLYSPPTPANYTQRSGRAGRNSESALVVTYLEDSTLGGYYYFNPSELISGRIYPPTFDLNLEYPVSKSIFSLFLQNILSVNNFIDLFPNKYWKSIYSWVGKYENIKKCMKEYYTNTFKLIITEFSESIFPVKDIIDYDRMFSDWISKLDKCIDFARLEYNSNQENKDTLTIFRLFGLIPDFAFGSGCTIIKIKDKPSVLGFSLKETCPPSTLDANKRRYKCKSISINKSNIIEFTTKYKICEMCNVILISEQYSVCPICEKNLISVQRTLFKPQLIYAQEKKFNLNPKKIDWEIVLIDPPENFKSLQKTFKCNIGLKYAGVRNNPEYHICEKCGVFYTIYDKQSVCRDKGKHANLDGTILDKYNTVATHINLNNYLDNKLKDTKVLDKTTLNTLLASARLISGCEDGEIDGLRIGDGEFIFFDTVEGGVGFIEIFNTNFKKILEKAIELCKNPCCINGCIKCIGSYKRQGDLTFLNKQQILPILENILRKV
ncbi:MAG: DEAD/DEAH box helicase [Candidatus ainarchaeum sp.]|nr:DEAD/DEAH box helicase [Candidatus ainarchaeum sp.]